MILTTLQKKKTKDMPKGNNKKQIKMLSIASIILKFNEQNQVKYLVDYWFL